MKCIKVEQKSEVRKQKGNQAGQAVMEFVLGLMVVISFFFFFIKMSAVFVVGNYIHYATFMSARAYMSSANTESEQLDHANTVLKAMVDKRWLGLIRPDGGAGGSVKGGYVGPGNFAQDSIATDYWNQGATFAYSTKLTVYPWNKEGQGIDLKLTSESWMPREQSVDECNGTKGKVQAQVTQAVGRGDVQVEWDENGC